MLDDRSHCMNAKTEVSQWANEAEANSRSLHLLVPGLAWLLTALAVGCTPSQYARQADNAAGGALAVGQGRALGDDKPFDVNYKPLAASMPAGPIQVGNKTLTVGKGTPQAITLNECLEIAFRNSRAYQSRKEDLYSAALAVASSRRTWDYPALGGDVRGSASRSVVNKGADTNSGAATVEPTLTQRLADGGVCTLAAAVSLATDMLGSDGTTVGSTVSANFTQPLLRNAWDSLAYETTYRLERDFIFSVYDYERFTQTFAADIVTRFYNVLQQRDQLENERVTIERLKRTVALTRLQVDSGARSRVELDQAEQNQIDAEVRFQQDQQSYQDALDNLKLTLGLPIAVDVTLDDGELAALRQAGPQPLTFEEGQAIETALATRPDILTQAAKVRDADRNVTIAINNFLPQLDVSVGISAPSIAKRDFQDVRFDRHTRTAGVVFNYPLDQVPNRDAYRNAMLAADKAKRDFAEFCDSVRLEVRSAYRQMLQTRRSSELQTHSVEIAIRRTRLAMLQQQSGLLAARDVLDAEEALRTAKNGLISALVTYTNTRLVFLAKMGMVDVDDRGGVHERTGSFRFDRIQKRYPYVKTE